MTIVDLNKIESRKYPARRETQNLVGGDSPIQSNHFCLGYVTLEPDGGQVPWHNHKQEEVYFILEGSGEMCVGNEWQIINSGQIVYIPPNKYHQLTNIGKTSLKMLYCYGPAGEVSHWRQELEGTLAEAGVNAPPLPEGAHHQFSENKSARK